VWLCERRGLRPNRSALLTVLTALGARDDQVGAYARRERQLLNPGVRLRGWGAALVSCGRTAPVAA
jgi:hypothetical protein